MNIKKWWYKEKIFQIKNNKNNNYKNNNKVNMNKNNEEKNNESNIIKLKGINEEKNQLTFENKLLIVNII